MARILHNDEWFEEIASHGHYESEFEKVLQQEAARLFGSYHFVPFKTTVYSEIDADSRQPDFALIHESYRNWWVVEVELGHHSFGGHVLPQVRTLSRANYGLAEAEFLCQRNPSLDRAKVIEMFKGGSPRVLVVVNAPVDGWAEPLRVLGAKIVICQIFRSRLNRYVLRVNGEYPAESDEIVTTCECQQLLHRMMEIDAPAMLPAVQNGAILLYHDGKATEWERIETASKVFLHAMRDHGLKPGRRYEIVRQGDGTLAIRPHERQRG